MEEKLVFLTVVSDYEVDLVCQRLKEAGIEYLVRDETTNAWQRLYGGASLTGKEILVRASQLIKAKELLNIKDSGLKISSQNRRKFSIVKILAAIVVLYLAISLGIQCYLLIKANFGDRIVKNSQKEITEVKIHISTELETYVNNEYGFRIKYPKDWSLWISQPDEFSPKGDWGEQIGELAVFQSRTIGSPYCELHFTIYSNLKNLSVRDFWRERLAGVYKFKSSESITFGEDQVSGVRFLMERTDQPLPNESMAVVIKKNNNIIELFWWGQNPSVSNPDCSKVDQILSTFKFLE